MNRLFCNLMFVMYFGLSFGQGALPLAKKQFEMRAYQEAIVSFEKALEGDAENQDIIAQIARCHIQLDQNLQAATRLESILERSDLNPEHLFLYARTLQSLRLFGKAKFYFLKYAKHDAVAGNHFAKGCDFARQQIKSVEEYDIVNLDINTANTEFGPAIYNKTMVWSSFRNDVSKDRKVVKGKTGSVVVGSQLFKTKYGSWSATPKYVLNDITNGENIGPVSYSGDGNWVAYTKNGFQDGQRLFDPNDLKMSLYIAQVDEKGSWSNTKPFPYNSNAFATGYPFLSADGTMLYFASTRPGGFGGYDVYVSFRSGQDWSEPQNLGSAINTRGNEISPGFDGKALYFSSDWHHGIGGFDIFKATSNSGQWTAVYHMGVGVNSAKDDLFYQWKSSKGTAYFCSNRVNGRGQYDLYSAVPLYQEITVKVIDKQTMKPLSNADVSFANGVRKGNTDKAGKFLLHIAKNGHDRVVISKLGYLELAMQVKSGTPSTYEVFIEKDVTKDIATASPTEEKTIVQPLNTAPDKVITMSEVMAKEKVKTVPPKPESYPKPATEIIEGFAIQVAAIGQGKYNPFSYQSLKMYGDLMPVDVGQLTKVRVGLYPHEKAAKEALRGVKAAGYTDAFIVREATTRSIAQHEPVPEGYSNTHDMAYKVRLATYSEPKYFNPDAVDHLGQIEQYTKKKWTIMLLSGYSSRAEAERALVEARQKGFTDAYVVIDRGGVLERVKVE